MEFDEDLRYGVVLTSMPRDHEWWHGHLVRTNLLYQCELLDRRTTMLLLVQKFGTGASPRSKQFFLTLDGEGTRRARETNSGGSSGSEASWRPLGGRDRFPRLL